MEKFILEVRELKDGSWAVLITLPKNLVPESVTGFRSEQEAKAWIDRESADWLNRRLGQNMTENEPKRPRDVRPSTQGQPGALHRY